MPQGLFRSEVRTLPSHAVFVFTAVILVCPAKAGLYVELGGLVSTPLELSLVPVVLFALELLVLQSIKQVEQSRTRNGLSIVYGLDERQN